MEAHFAKKHLSYYEYAFFLLQIWFSSNMKIFMISNKKMNDML